MLQLEPMSLRKSRDGSSSPARIRDAFTETVSGLRHCDHRICHVDLCIAVSGADSAAPGPSDTGGRGDRAPPLSDRGAPSTLDILVGTAKEGEAYFNGAGHCTQCHSVTGDLAGIGSSYEPKTIQNLIISGGGMGVGRRAGGSGPPPKVPPTTVTVTLPSGQTVKGDLDHISAFVVALREPDGTYRSFARRDSMPKVVVTNPLQWHVDMLPKWRDADIHNLTAYLVTLK